MTPIDKRYRQEERLKSRKQIAALFKNRQSIGVYPLRIFWQCSPQKETSLPKIAFSVSKKTFKSAVKRNQYKRCMREAYRLNKGKLTEGLVNEGLQGNFMLIFVGKEEYDFKQIEKAWIALVDRFIKKNKLE